MALSDDPPALLNKGGTFRKGYHAALDELKELAFEGKDYLLKIQREESEKTGITSRSWFQVQVSISRKTWRIWTKTMCCW